MRRVADALFAPGQAIGGGLSKDLIDTEVDGVGGDRIYLDQRQAAEIAELSDYVAPQALAAVEEERDGLQAELDQALAENADLRAAIEEAESLRRAVAFTLERGAVVDQKKQTIGLRHIPGQKRIDLNESLWPEALQAEGVTD